MRAAFEAIRFGYAFFARHAGALVLLAAWRITVTLILLLAIDYLAPADMGDALAEAQLAGKYLALALARTLLYGATLSPVAMAWHRAAAGQGTLARWYVPTFTQGTLRYFLTVAMLALSAMAVLGVALLGGNALGATAADYFQVWQGPVSKVLFLASTALAVWAMARLAPLLPRAALEPTKPNVRETWVSSRGHAAALVLLMLACIAPAPVAMRLLVRLAADVAPYLTLPAKVLAELAGIFGILVFLAALTRFELARAQAAEPSG